MQTKTSRADKIAALVARDGTRCQHPDCDHELDFNAVGTKDEVTIDHWFSQQYGKEHNWTYNQIWDLSNLKLMCKRANARKSNLVPNPDGTLPAQKTSRFRYRRQKRSERPEICTSCSAGRDLAMDEVCASCGSGPQPERFPRWQKMRADECDHEIFWCAWCSIGVIPRAGATEMILIGGEGGE